MRVNRFRKDFVLRPDSSDLPLARRHVEYSLFTTWILYVSAAAFARHFGIITHIWSLIEAVF